MDGMKRSAGLTLAILTLALARHASAQAVIVDHTWVALFDQIPETYRRAAEDVKMMWVDRSVGANIDTALKRCLAVPWSSASTTLALASRCLGKRVPVGCQSGASRRTASSGSGRCRSNGPRIAARRTPAPDAATACRARESHDPSGKPCFDNRDGAPSVINGQVRENNPDDGMDLPALSQHYTTEPDGGHLGATSAGAIRLAKAWWVMMARIAGWQPGTSAASAQPMAHLLLAKAQISSTPRPSIDVYDLADYRLTPDVFDQFVQASGRVADITSHDAAFRYAPLFTKEVAVSGDAPAMASGLVARLENHAGLSAALQSANITPREYAKFAISLVAAHMAHQFITAGVLKRVPEGAPTINVEFVKSHESAVAAVLAQLGIQD